MLKRTLSVLSIFVVTLSVKASNLGATLELECPCTFSTDSITSSVIKAGITNIGSTATGALSIRVWAHSTTNLNDSIGGDAQLLVDLPITDSLAANSTLALASYKGGLRQPNDGLFYLTFRLRQDNAVIDAWATRDRVTLTGAGGGSGDAVGNVYFDSKPTHIIDDGTLTLNIPVIVNVSTATDHPIKVDLIATESTSFFGVPGFTLASQPYDDPLTAGSQTTEISPTFDFNLPSSGFDYYHIAVINTENNLALAFQTIRLPEGEDELTRAFSATSRDYLLDTDGDGVADINEDLAESNPDDPASTPDSSIVDVLALYAPAVTTLYDGDPSTRIDHLMTLSNQVLSDSGVDIVLRLVDSQEYDMDDAQNIDQWVDAADDRAGVFENLDTLRAASGADLIVLYRTFDDGDTCGIAQLGGFLTRGDFSSSSNASGAHTPVFIDADQCPDHTTIHEFGHLMGLGHSFKQDETGTFDWSRGYGVDDSFATVMGYPSVFDADGLQVFSSPDLMTCEGSPCGIDIDQAEAAHSVKSLNLVRFQVANFHATVIGDMDGDGVFDADDAFPEDANETVDSDGDGIGNNADTDDD
ncbi:MAG: zinc-dependent metalloprotease family protein, partial [Pseudomonadales bacterium]|nr:zinc-dependent metalloprotease family protein [Pseudomonadales bacterium]